MLDMLRTRTKTILWIVAIAFVVSLGAGSLFGRRRRNTGSIPEQGLIGIVEGTPIQYRDFSENYRARTLEYARQTGSEISDATRDAIREDVWTSMVTDILIGREIARLKINVPDEMVFDVLWNSPPQAVYQSAAFRDENGNFSFDAYHRDIQMHPERWEGVADYYRDSLQRQALQLEIQSGALVSDNQLWAEFLARNEKVRVSYVMLDPMRIDRSTLTPTEDEARAYFNTHRAEYERPATCVLSYVAFPKVATQEDEDDIVLRLEEIAAAVRDGEDFAEMARVYSEGPSGPQGGDLGYFGRDAMVDEFTEVAFGLDIGEVSDPFKTPFGYHIVTVEDRKTEDGELKVHARHILIEIRPSEQTLVEVETLVRELDEKAQGEGLAAAAEELGYDVASTAPFADGRYIPGIGNLRPAVKRAFGNDPGTMLGAYVTAEAYYIFEVEQKFPSVLPTYDDLAEEAQASGLQHPAIAALITERQSDRARAEAEAISEAVQAGELLETAASDRGYGVAESQLFSRRDHVPGVGSSNAFIGTSFGLRTGQTSGVVFVEESGRYYIIRSEEQIAANQQDYLAQEEQLKGELLQMEQMQMFASWLQDLMTDADIKDYRDTYF